MILLGSIGGSILFIGLLISIPGFRSLTRDRLQEKSHQQYGVPQTAISPQMYPQQPTAPSYNPSQQQYQMFSVPPVQNVQYTMEPVPMAWVAAGDVGGSSTSAPPPAFDEKVWQGHDDKR